MSSSNQTYKELAIPHLREVFEAIDEVMLKYEVPYYLIGASAIALQLLKENIKPGRGTKDIDFAIMISSAGVFDSIVNELNKHGFNKVQAPWTLYHPGYNVAIDLLPFGETEGNITLNFHERQTDLHVLGFKEVLKDTNKVAIEEKYVQIPTLPGMVILKLIAWSDRPEDRGNDLYDILRIIEHYFSLNYDEIVEHHYDIFAERDFDQLMIAARVLGRHAGHFLIGSRQIKDRILLTLNNNTINPQTSIIARQWAQEKQWDLEYAHALLEELKSGLFENIS